jgi:hypothetical protein
MKIYTPILLFVTASTFISACIIVPADHADCIDGSCSYYLADIGFYWEFENPDGSLTDDCSLANVRYIDVAIYDRWDYLEFEAWDQSCHDCGIVVENFEPGTYWLELTAINPSGHVTHQGTWEIEIYTGYNELGFLALSYIGS